MITFVIGVILGAVGMYTFAWNMGHWRRHLSEQAVIHDMQRRLDLSPQQTQELRPILDEGGKQIHDLQVQLHPQYTALHRQIEAHIRQILNPDQAKKFDEILLQKQRARGEAVK